MRKLGLMCSRNRVARLVHAANLCAKQTRRYRSTTKRHKADRVAPNRLNRDFGAERPNQKWLADITCIPTQEGWLYVAVIFDLFSRRRVGWAMSKRMTGEATLRALHMAIRRCRTEPGLIHHSDQGSQYTDGNYQAALAAHDLLPTMNGVGSWYDNAPMESFFGTLKSELVHHHLHRTYNEARPDLFYDIDGFYNRTRLHSSLGYMSPEAYKQLYHEHHELRLSPCP